MHRLTLLAATAAATLTLAAAGAANAQQYNRLVVFGDSLSDNGNLYAATAGTNPPSPPYYQGRFSNGPVFSELLGFSPLQRGALGAFTGNVNYAFGGARTDNAATPPGMRSQLALYLSRGGTFASTDLVTVWGGANDIFQGIPVAAVSPSPTTVMATVANNAAANIGFITGQVAGAGAGTVLVGNLPNLGYTPQFLGGPAQPLAEFSSNTFNAALLTQLNTVAAGTNNNIILFDVARASDFVRLNPGAVGFTNVTQACLNTTTGAVCSTPDTYLYWDNVHPTAKGHQFLAALATDYLYYGDLAAPQAHVAESGLDHRLQALERGLDRAEAGELAPGAADVALLIDFQDTSFDADGVMPEGDSRSASVRVAANYAVSQALRLGAMISVSDGAANPGPLEFDLRTFAADASMGWRSGGVFVNAAAGFGFDEYDDFERFTPVGGFVQRVERVEGWSAGARVQAGLWRDMGGVALSPRVSLNALRTKVEGYEETGPGARHRIAEREVGGLAGEIALRAESELSQAVRIHGEIGYRDWLASDFDDVRVSLVDNPANELSAHGHEDGGSLLLDAGLSMPLGGFTVGAGYRGRVSDSSQSHAGLLSISMRY
ncbi:MAG TPA: SGNH/GDSL hydrolase family protein [Caulobacteraceae bacterium]|jgi:outer membrane lipase/esterase